MAQMQLLTMQPVLKMCMQTFQGLSTISTLLLLLVHWVAATPIQCK